MELGQIYKEKMKAGTLETREITVPLFDDRQAGFGRVVLNYQECRVVFDYLPRLVTPEATAQFLGQVVGLAVQIAHKHAPEIFEALAGNKADGR